MPDQSPFRPVPQAPLRIKAVTGMGAKPPNTGQGRWRDLDEEAHRRLWAAVPRGPGYSAGQGQPRAGEAAIPRGPWDPCLMMCQGAREGWELTAQTNRVQSYLPPPPQQMRPDPLFPTSSARPPQECHSVLCRAPNTHSVRFCKRCS